MILLKSAIIRVFVEVFPPQRHLPREYFYDFFFSFSIFNFLVFINTEELLYANAKEYRVEAM